MFCKWRVPRLGYYGYSMSAPQLRLAGSFAPFLCLSFFAWRESWRVRAGCCQYNSGAVREVRPSSLLFPPRFPGQTSLCLLPGALPSPPWRSTLPIVWELSNGEVLCLLFPYTTRGLELSVAQLDVSSGKSDHEFATVPQRLLNRGRKAFTSA